MGKVIRPFCWHQYFVPHTCHILHCDIYLAHLEANSHNIFQISQNFQNILQDILWRNKHKSHFVVFITSFLHLNKGFWQFWGTSKVIFVKNLQNFIKSHLKICHISQISLHSLWHVWSPGVCLPLPWGCKHVLNHEKLYKIRLQRHFFETCNKWMKWWDISVDIKILSPGGCLPLPQGYIYVLNH